MKKFGFTLSEILITVGIVGVVAALTAPAVSNIMPDKNKMMFMKNYKELTSLTEKMLNDPELYYTTYAIANENGVDLDGDGETDVIAGRKYPTCIGLGCDGQPKKEPYKSNIGDKDKFAFILSDLLGADIDSIDSTNATFKTPDGTKWETEFYGDTDENVIYNVYFSVNSVEDKDCMYNCKKPNKFCLELDSYGIPKSCDYLSEAYLLNPNNMNNKKKDLACAEALKNGEDNCDDIE